MSRIGLVALLAGIVLGYGNPVLAQGGGAGQHDGVSGGGDKKRGGAAIDHRSQKANENSNAQWSTSATKGKDRADLRHQQKQDRNHGKKHGKKHGDKARGHDKDDDDGKARGHNKDHGGKARGHGKDKAGKGSQDGDSN